MKTSEKFKKVRKALGLTQKEFAKPMHVEGGYISDIEHGRKEPSEKTIEMMMVKHNVSSEWWRTGEGEIFQKQGFKPSGKFPEVGMLFNIAEGRLEKMDQNQQNDYLAHLLKAVRHISDDSQGDVK